MLDIEDIVNRLSLSLRAVRGAELPALSAAADARARAVARYVSLIASAYAEGTLAEDEMRRELDEIERMTRGYAGGMRGLSGAGVEHAARAAVTVIFGALRAALSFAGAPLSESLSAQLGARVNR